MTIATEAYDSEFEQSRETLQDNLIACRLRLTAVTNAASDLLRVMDDLTADIASEIRECTAYYDGVDLDRIRSDLRTAISVARGGSEKLPVTLLDDTVDRPSLIRAGERLGLL